MVKRFLVRLFDERVSRAFAAIFLLSFSYMVIFGKGFEGMSSSQAFLYGLATPFAIYNLVSGFIEQQPRKKSFRRVMKCEQ